jgi:hypothetical protein
MSTPKTEPTGKAGRYQRSAAGLVTSLVVTVIGLGALLYFTGAFRHDLVIKPEAIDYAGTIASAQKAGLTPVYPSTLPDCWIARGVDIVPGDDPVFMVRLLTDDGDFVGVRQEDSTIPALLAKWVDEETQVADAYTVPASVTAPVVRDWKGYTDDGGDTAFAAELGDDSLLVFGSASARDLQVVVDSLTTEPIKN